MEPNFLTARASRTQRAASDLDGAETDYLQVLERDETNVLALMGLASIEHRRGNTPVQREWLEKAVATNPNTVTPAIGLAESYVAAGELPSAIELLESLVPAHSQDTRLLTALGHVQEAAGRSADAIDTYRRLVKATSGAADARVLLVQSQFVAGEAKAARRGLEDSLYVHPGHALTADALVRLVEETEGSEASLGYAKELQKLFPDAPWSDQLIGDLHFRAGRFEAASAAYEKAWAKSPSAALAIALSETRIQRATSQQTEESGRSCTSP